MDTLRIKNVTKSFGGIKAVDGCFFAVESGKVTALIGPNGAGKTTIFDIISGFQKVHSGTIEFQGERIEHLPPHERARRGIARTFQHVRLFQNLSLTENIEIVREHADRSLWKCLVKGRRGTTGVQSVLKRMGIERDESALASELSFGQQKLLELARVLELPHHLLMLDEPVAGVSPHLRTQLLAVLQGLKEHGETILVIEHDMDFVMHVADTVIVMDEGRVLTEGTPEEVQKHPEVLEAYLGGQL